MISEFSFISKSKIDPTVSIGPFCVAGDDVVLGKNNKLISHVSITGKTTIVK